jgi:heterodisulfide reductase subunit B
MQYSYFAGCKIPYHLPDYGNSTLALLHFFDIDLLNLEFNCCGYPVHDIDFQSFLLAGARNLALAEQKRTDIVTPCKCCFGSLKFVEHYLKHNQPIRDQINAMLLQEGLQWEGRNKVKHLLTVLHCDIGVDRLKAVVVNRLDGVKVAIHAGCHALRPSHVTQYDNPLTPAIFKELVMLTGARSIFWSMSLECCGNPQWDKNRKLALKQMQRKLLNAEQAGADFVCTACTYCQMQFEQQDQSGPFLPSGGRIIPSILISQLLGLSIGLKNAETGLGEEMQQELTAYAVS